MNRNTLRQTMLDNGFSLTSVCDETRFIAPPCCYGDQIAFTVPENPDEWIVEHSRRPGWRRWVEERIADEDAVAKVNALSEFARNPWQGMAG